MMMAVTLTTLITLLSTASCGRVMVGGKTEVADVRTNKEVQELGRFAVKEYNARLQESDDVEGGSEAWKFVEVVSGVKYYLIISATRNGVKYKKLLHFGPLPDFPRDM